MMVGFLRKKFGLVSLGLRLGGVRLLPVLLAVALPVTAFSSEASLKSSANPVGEQRSGEMASGQPLLQEADEQDKKASASTSESGSGSPISDYGKALDLLREEQLPALARKHLKIFMENYPGSSLLPNALYWLGETYYTEKRYKKAIGSFGKVLNMFPWHPKAPDALLKIGFSYKALNNMPSAKYNLKRVIQLYPESRSAKLAQETLRESN